MIKDDPLNVAMKAVELYASRRPRPSQVTQEQAAEMVGVSPATGITVCNSWLKFENFFADMGARPTSKHSLERIDNAGGYCKGNCKWATRLEQAGNKRNNRLLTVDGETQHLMEWSRRYSVGHTIILSRLSRGWSVKDAVTTPPRNGNYRKS